MSWKSLSLGDALSVKHGFAFKSTYFSDRGPFLVLTPGNFHEHGGFRLRTGKDRWYTGHFPEEYILSETDIIVAMTEQGPGLLGSSAIVPEGNRYLHNQRLGLVTRLDESVLDRKFTYYLFNTKSVRGQISSSASGTKVRHTSPDRIYRVRVRVPGVESQARIADIFSAYDDLIENNRRRIALLEQAARELYREWFVRLRFPGHENTLIVDGVPEDWSRGRISDLGKVVTGKTPSKKRDSYYGDDVPFIKTPDMHGYTVIVGTEESLSAEGANSQANKMLPSMSILVSCIGTVGAVALNAEPAQTNQQINAIIPRVDRFRYWSFFMAKTLKTLLEGMGGGATMTNVSKSKFSAIKVVVPSQLILEQFDSVVSLNIDQIEQLSAMNKLLTNARNLLLPRLMSGKVTV